MKQKIIPTIAHKSLPGDIELDYLMSVVDGRYNVVAKIKDHYRRNAKDVYAVDWFVDPLSLDDESISGLVYYTKDRKNINHSVNWTIMDDALVSNGVESKNLIKMLKSEYEKDDTMVFVSDERFNDFKTVIQAESNIKTLFHTYPVYKNIMLEIDGKATASSIIDLLAYMPEKEAVDRITAFQYSNGYLITLKNLAERILESANVPKQTRDLMTQEQQVEAFIEFSKVVANETEELVSDDDIDAIRNSEVYQKVTEKLQSHGFRLSETQQFNVFQQVGLLHNRDENTVFNLSDMGSGKTLMTTEAIFLMDLKMADTFSLHPNRTRFTEHVESMSTPDKNLITPKLSVVSSWVKTFELFYDVERVNDNTYTLSFEHKGVTFTSKLNVAPFTVKSNAIAVDSPLPMPKTKEYLIVDEVHQLVKKKISRTRFFQSDVNPSSAYKAFILSGTLSNLTTHEWLNYVQLMLSAFNNTRLDTGSSNDLSTYTKYAITKLNGSISESSLNVLEQQHRYFDPQAMTENQTEIAEKRMNNKEKYFHTLYSSKILELRPGYQDRNIEDDLFRGNYNVAIDPAISDVPNFELFYNLVGHRAITAQSITIAEELFGEQKTQHNADVIKTPSMLTGDDIEIIRALHKITADYNIYKSKLIANRINNAILNLNDGLQTKNIYEILSYHAEHNTRFLEYLTGLDINILEKLPQSNLITKPKLEDTRKFEILKDILESEKNETHLIVVNDFQAMKTLSKALEIEHMTMKETKDALGYQDVLDAMFEKQSIVIVPQEMIKSSLDLVQANRLIQYQLNSEISDIIQTQNRINRIGQTRETKAYYIATDTLQENIIELFLETYKNIRVAHKGIVELFVDMSSQVNVVNDYISKALNNVVAAESTASTTTTVALETAPLYEEVK